MKVYVIIPAAGLGTRMMPAGKKPHKISKQFVPIAGEPILMHTLKRFVQSPRVSEVYLAMRKAEGKDFESRLAKEKLDKPVYVVEGGEHRQHSVANALTALAKTKPKPDDVVLVHDAVRPFIDTSVIEDVIDAVATAGAAIAGLPAVDTIKQVERTAHGAIVTSTIPRERVVQAQTPQGARYSILKKAFDDAATDGFVGTDEASLVERSGHQVSVVMGSPHNIKITTPADMELAEFLISKGR